MLQGLKKGNEVLGELQKEMSIEDVEQLLADTSEAIAYQNVQTQLFSSESRLLGNFANARRQADCRRRRGSGKGTMRIAI